jgi:ATP-dependent DNA helicase RecQ
MKIMIFELNEASLGIERHCIPVDRMHHRDRVFINAADDGDEVPAVVGEYQTLAITPDSGEVLRGERQVMLRRDAPMPKPPRTGRGPGARAKAGADGGGGSARPEAADLSPEDAALFEQLRAWRGATAREQSLPAYTVFHDATLRAIAVARPATLAELSEINGVGEAKLAKYGAAVLELLAGSPDSP